MSDDNDYGITLEHVLAGAILANDGSLTFDFELMLSKDIIGKQFSLSVDDGVATVTLVEEK